MNSNLTMNRMAERSPQFKARMTGLFLLLTVLAGIFGQVFVSDKLFIADNPAATAANLLGHESLLWTGAAVFLIETICQITMATLFYELLKPVNKTVSLLALLFNLSGCIIKTLSRLFFVAPLLVLSSGEYLKVFNAEQLQTLALLLFKINDHGAAMAMVFFGFSSLLRGFLIFKSTYLPRFLGVLGILGGLGWLSFLYLPFGYKVGAYAALLGLIGAAAQIFWLLVFGVNEARWKDMIES